nr:probable serine/threonine-protein kinase mps1 isoform X2 [Aedes albopictus]
MGPTKMTPEDQAFNITFVGEVKKHPCLFDSNSTEYKQAQVQDKAWSALSANVGESVDMCKKRWRNLRCCMTRYLKSVRDNIDNSSSLRRKPYYLYNHMQFVIPYLKMKDGETATAYESEDSVWIKNHNSAEDLMKSESEIVGGEEVAEEEEEEEEHEIESIDVQDEDHQQIKQSIIQSIKILPMNQETQAQETTTTYEIIEATPAKQPRIEAIHQVTPASSAQQSTHIIKSKDGSYKNFTYATVAQSHPSGTTMYTSTPTITGQYTLQQQQAPSSSSTSTSNLQRQQSQSSQQQQQQQQQVNVTGATDADNNFFKSLIPDIQSMNMHQKRKLKIGILRLIDEILSTT